MNLPFRTLANSYDVARRDYPDTVINLVNQIIDNCDADSIDLTELSRLKLIVDLGCGTGISTRQLDDISRNIIGVDLDIEMLNKAIVQSPSEIQYICSDVASLKLDKPVDVVTMFASMHWFSDSESMDAIKNLMTNSGIVIAVNRLDIEFRTAIVKIINKYKHEDRGDIKKNFSHEKVFAENSFKIISADLIDDVEIYSEVQLENYISSMSVYNFVDDVDKPKVIEEIKASLLDSNGICNRKVVFQVTSAKLA
jgi:trans-aconitate methyltransferase